MLYNLYPIESYAGAFEMICIFFTIIAVFASYVLTARA